MNDPQAPGPAPALSDASVAQLAGWPSAPPTGDLELDRALAGLTDLADHPVEDHYDHLVGAHEALHAALDRDGG